MHLHERRAQVLEELERASVQINYSPRGAEAETLTNAENREQASRRVFILLFFHLSAIASFSSPFGEHMGTELAQIRDWSHPEEVGNLLSLSLPHLTVFVARDQFYLETFCFYSSCPAGVRFRWS